MADSDYDGCRISSVVRRGNLHGCQFHPEFKSRPTRPAPLFRDFVGAAIAFRNAAPAETPQTGTTAAA